jgi:hypothetical protein
MAAITIVLLITILCVAHFYLKNGALFSFATLISVVLASIIAFGFYEFFGGMLLSRDIMPLRINGAIFLALFGLSFAGLHVLNGILVGSSIEFGRLINVLAAVICGTITGLIVSGCVLIGFNLASLPSKLSYKRFDGTISRSAINDPRKSLLGSDDLVAGLLGWVSRGSMSGKKSFALYHSDFNSQIHLSRHLLGDNIIPVSALSAVNIPKLGVRKKETDDGKSYTAIRVEINGAKIDKGGATDKDGHFGFAPFQLRLICQAGDGQGIKVLYPDSIKIYTKGKPIRKITEFGNAVMLDREDFTMAGSKKLAVMDLAFNVPSNVKPVLLEFKNSAVTEVPALSRDEDTEEKLNAIFKSK